MVNLNGIKRKTQWGDIVWRHPKTGKHHRLDGPARIDKNGYKAYLINGKWHNINGPARIWDGDKKYWIDGVLYGSNHINHQWLLISLKRKLIQRKKY